jgi:hypothetical protein
MIPLGSEPDLNLAMVAMPKGDRRVSMVLENETEKV